MRPSMLRSFILSVLCLNVFSLLGQSKIYYNNKGEITLGELATHYRVGAIDAKNRTFIGLVQEFDMKEKKFLEITYSEKGIKESIDYDRGGLKFKTDIKNGKTDVIVPDSIWNQIIAKEKFTQAIYIRKRDFPELKDLLQIAYVADTVKVNGEIFTTVEEMPVFPGGMNMLSEFLGYNLVMPKLAKERGLTGRVFVMFTIMQDGAVGDLKVIKGIGLGCDEAALFAVSVLPDWKPGYQRGKPVKVRMTLPITFR
jgi:hypothetical protein